MNALVFAGNDGVGLGLAVAIHSAVTYFSGDAHVVVLDTGLSRDTRSRLARVASHVQFVEAPPELFNGLPTARHWGVGTYARLFIPDLLPQVERAVYLDADVLVRRDLAPLFGIDLGGAPLAAVREFYRPLVDGRPYFNAGLLVMDCDAWRTSKLGRNVLSYLADHGEGLEALDQDGLNHVVSDWKELDWRWNVQQVLRWIEDCTHTELTDQLVAQRDTLYAEAAVLHFLSEPKPWYHSCDAPATWKWIRSLLGSRYYGRIRLTRWLGAWLVMRGAKRSFSIFRVNRHAT